MTFNHMQGGKKTKHLHKLSHMIRASGHTLLLQTQDEIEAVTPKSF